MAFRCILRAKTGRRLNLLGDRHANPSAKRSRRTRGELITTLERGLRRLPWPSATRLAQDCAVRRAKSQNLPCPRHGCTSLRWAVGGIYMSLGALQFAELGALLPQSGGQYNFSRAALGDYVGLKFYRLGRFGFPPPGSFAATSPLCSRSMRAILLPFAAWKHVPADRRRVQFLLFALLQWKSMRVPGGGVAHFTTIL